MTTRYTTQVQGPRAILPPSYPPKTQRTSSPRGPKPRTQAAAQPLREGRRRTRVPIPGGHAYHGKASPRRGVNHHGQPNKAGGNPYQVVSRLRTWSNLSPCPANIHPPKTVSISLFSLIDMQLHPHLSQWLRTTTEASLSSFTSAIAQVLHAHQLQIPAQPTHLNLNIMVGMARK